MLKRTTSIILALIIVAATFSVVAAYGDGNYRKGKFQFRKYCRTCHAEGATGAKPAADLSPASKTA